jgi:hypothetical protein
LSEYFAQISATARDRATARIAGSASERFPSTVIEHDYCDAGGRSGRAQLIAFDDDTFDRLKQLARAWMATVQELAGEAFADVPGKHGIPVDLAFASSILLFAFFARGCQRAQLRCV